MVVASYSENVPGCVQQLMNAIDVVHVAAGPQDSAVRVMSHWDDYAFLFCVAMTSVRQWALRWLLRILYTPSHPVHASRGARMLQ